MSEKLTREQMLERILEDVLIGMKRVLMEAEARISVDLFQPRITERIENMELTVRATNCLRAEGITTIGELLRYSERDLLRLPGVGIKVVREVRKELVGRGLALSETGIHPFL